MRRWSTPWPWRLDPPPKRRRAGKAGDDDDLEYIVANPNDVWSNVDDSGCTLRLLRPHEHNDAVHALLSLLESEFGCMVGSNAYLTPQGSQGFAPHYDDVDVLVLQLEGRKRWRVRPPLRKGDALPRASSRDFSEEEVREESEGSMDVTLGPGDVLYLPRGWIHQAETADGLAGATGKGGHSLHLTVSAMQSWCWADFLEVLMTGALEGAAASDRSASLREGLPRNFLGYRPRRGGPTGTTRRPARRRRSRRGRDNEYRRGGGASRTRPGSASRG